ncbi:MAG TPA: DUF5606 domain-containing protein [Bacteroidia bacterium]|nr:DUF5606 domain-containing protein [Bacteroidia bacterium]
MGLKGIISVSGMPGLYKVLAQSKTGFIVESLSDRKRMPVSSTQRISMLEDISLFTTGDDMPLKEVMQRLKDYTTEATPDPKSDPATLKDYFKKVIPEFDEERVYNSDIKKILSWFNMIKDLLDVEDDPEQDESAAESDASPEGEKSDTPVKKSGKKKNDTEGE